MLLVAPALWHLTSCWWCFSSFKTSSIWGSLQTVPHRTKLAESSPLTMAPWHVKVWFLATLKIFQLLLHEALVHDRFFYMLKGWHNLLGQSSWLLPSFSLLGPTILNISQSQVELPSCLGAISALGKPARVASQIQVSTQWWRSIDASTVPT